MKKELTWIEINQKNIKNNVDVIRRAVGPGKGELKRSCGLPKVDFWVHSGLSPG